MWEHGSLHKNYMIGKDVVRGLCSYLGPNSVREAELGVWLEGCTGIWKGLKGEWTWVRTFQGSSKGERRKESHVPPLLEHFREVAHNISAFIIGQNLITWPCPVAKKVDKCIIYSEWPFTKLKWEILLLRKKIRRNIRRTLAIYVTAMKWVFIILSDFNSTCLLWRNFSLLLQPCDFGYTCQ